MVSPQPAKPPAVTYDQSQPTAFSVAFDEGIAAARLIVCEALGNERGEEAEYFVPSVEIQRKIKRAAEALCKPSGCLAEISESERPNRVSQLLIERLQRAHPVSDLGSALFLSGFLGSGRLPSSYCQTFQQICFSLAHRALEGREVSAASLLVNLAIRHSSSVVHGAEALQTFLVDGLKRVNHPHYSLLTLHLEASLPNSTWKACEIALRSSTVLSAVRKKFVELLDSNSIEHAAQMACTFGGVTAFRERDVDASIDSAILLIARKLSGTKDSRLLVERLGSLSTLISLRDPDREMSKPLRGLIEGSASYALANWWKLAGENYGSDVSGTVAVVLYSERILTQPGSTLNFIDISNAVRQFAKAASTVPVDLLTFESVSRLAQRFTPTETVALLSKNVVDLKVSDAEKYKAERKVILWACCLSSRIVPTKTEVHDIVEKYLGEADATVNLDKVSSKQVAAVLTYRRELLQWQSGVIDNIRTTTGDPSFDPDVLKTFLSTYGRQLHKDYGAEFIKPLTYALENVGRRFGAVRLAHQLRTNMLGGPWGNLSHRTLVRAAEVLERQIRKKDVKDLEYSPQDEEKRLAVRQAIFLRRIGCFGAALSAIRPVSEAATVQNRQLTTFDSHVIDYELLVLCALGLPTVAAQRLENAVETTEHHPKDGRELDWVCIARGYLGLALDPNWYAGIQNHEPNVERALAAVHKGRLLFEGRPPTERAKVVKTFPHLKVTLTLYEKILRSIHSNGADTEGLDETLASIEQVNIKKIGVRTCFDLLQGLIPLGELLVQKNLHQTALQFVGASLLFCEKKLYGSVSSNTSRTKICLLQLKIAEIGLRAATGSNRPTEVNAFVDKIAFLKKGYGVLSEM